MLVAGAAQRATPSTTSRLQTKQCVMGLSDCFGYFAEEVEPLSHCGNVLLALSGSQAVF